MSESERGLMQAQILEHTEILRRRASDERAKLVRRRAENMEIARRNTARIQQIMRTKFEDVKSGLSQEALRREAVIRVNRSLESLEKLIPVLRRVNLNDEYMLRAIRDPIVMSEAREVSGRTLAANLLRTAQRDIITESEVVTIAAHELRTPIMPILASVELLREKVPEGYPELAVIERNALRLQRLAENILYVAKAESGSQVIQRKRFDLNALVKSKIEDLAITTRGTGLKVVDQTSRGAAFVMADEDQVNQVLTNLLENAAKATGAGEVAVSTTAVDGMVVATVRDTGPGIEPSLKPVLFTKFATRSSKGTGLGLYVCKRIVETHGGSIWAGDNEREGHGAVFSFSLPSG